MLGMRDSEGFDCRVIEATYLPRETGTDQVVSRMFKGQAPLQAAVFERIPPVHTVEHPTARRAGLQASYA